MKKTLITLILSSLAISSYANDEFHPLYVGLKSGWASVHHGVNQFKHNANQTSDSSVNRHSVTYGAFVGYKLNPSFATELGYEYFGHLSVGKANREFNEPQFKHSAHGASLNFKYNYPITESLNIFTKLGGAYVYNTYKFTQENSDKTRKASKATPSLVAGVGFDYEIAPELIFRTEYQYLNKVGKNPKINGTRLKYKPDFHAVTVGLIYQFGASKVSEPIEVAQQIDKLFEFDTDVLFDFGKASLKATSTQVLDKVYQDIAGLELTHANINVNGYTDRLGSSSFNQKLSQKRADNVANYIIDKGINPAAVTAIGHGKSSPVTGNNCDTIKNRTALISCLAPDRRVSVQVKGTK